MKRLVPLVFGLQKILLIVSYHAHHVFGSRAKRKRLDWVIGTEEIASMVFQWSGAIDRSYSVSLSPTTYPFEYDFKVRGRSARSSSWFKMLVGPILLGRLMIETRGILYVGSKGFLLDTQDERDFELGFVKSKGIKVGILWCGSDIRSTRKMHELEASMGLPNISTYISTVTNFFETEAHESQQRKRAAAGMAHADITFDNPVDHSSYLVGHREPLMYFLPDDAFASNLDKLTDLTRPVITHATTSPIIKGTPLVRAAIAKLAAEGYDFEYVELIGVSHDDVKAALARTHIALNQFYGFSHAVFSVESLAAGCAVLASTDATVEPILPPHTNESTFVTKHWQIYDHVKALLDDHALLTNYARFGHEWARRYTSARVTGKLLQGLLDAVLENRYDPKARAQLDSDGLYSIDPVLGVNARGSLDES